MRQAVLVVAMLVAGCRAAGAVECAAGFTLCEGVPASIDGVPTGDAGFQPNPVEEYPLACIDLQSDVDNCGACGASCGARGCVAGKCGACRPNYRSGLMTDSECFSNADCCDGECRRQNGGDAFIGLCE